MEQELSILKSHRQQTLQACYLTYNADVMNRFMEAHGQQVPVRHLCQVLDVVSSRYCAWRKQLVVISPVPVPSWEAAMIQVFAQHQLR
ncbi:MAG: hypothetical protein ACRYG7_08770 [Janthinobacterium lividum]